MRGPTRPLPERFPFPRSRLGWLGLILGLASALAGIAADPGDTRLVANLLWGTNGGKPPDKELKPVDPALEKRLRRVFKWQSYYEIERKEFGVGAGKTSRLEMSKECRLEVNRLAGDEFEIHLYGKGVLIVTKRQRIVPGETVVLGGDDKNDNAWFVVVALPKAK